MSLMLLSAFARSALIKARSCSASWPEYCGFDLMSSSFPKEQRERRSFLLARCFPRIYSILVLMSKSLYAFGNFISESFLTNSFIGSHYLTRFQPNGEEDVC